MLGVIIMADATMTIEESYVQLLEKITALSRGFLMVKDDDTVDKRCSFCRGLLILFNQIQAMPHKEN
jgi:hypothetical protein